MSSSKKSPAQQQADLVRQIMTEFDIQTHVKKMTVEALDSYMRSNQHAFDYVEKWQNQFINFEHRLIKAQNYYKNIEANINAKIQVTNNLDQKINKFSQDFWQGMKESQESLEQMRKNYLNLVRETGTQANTIKNFEKQQTNLYNKINRTDSRYDEEIQKILYRINQIDENVNVKNSERIKQVSQLLEQFATSKSELDSKINLIIELSKNLELYKEQKILINSKIDQLYSQINTRVFQQDLNEVKRYIDNNFISQKKRVDLEFQKLHQITKEEEQVRKNCDERLKSQLEEQKNQNQKSFIKVRNEEDIKHQEILKQISEFQKKTLQEFKKKQLSIDNNAQRISNNDQCITELQSQVELIKNDLQNKENRLTEAESNILSFNQLLNKIQKENLQRTQEMAELKLDNEEKGDIGDQVKKISEKVMAHDEYFKFMEEKISLNATNFTQFSQKTKQETRKILTNISSLKQKTEKNHNELSSSLKNIHSSLTNSIEEKNSSLIQYVNKQIGNKIDSIKEKFEFLESISSEIKKFKEEFEKQLQTNDQLNKEIKEKVDRMFAMLTKLKSDMFVKFENLSQDTLKNSNKTKQLGKVTDDVCMYLSDVNEILTSILAIEFWTGFKEENTEESYKIASILEGWVLEIQDKERAKYRGELLNRKNLMQLMLDHFVKGSQKFKGGIIANGKQIFSKIANTSDQYNKIRIRSISRKKHRMSELPKVYR